MRTILTLLLSLIVISTVAQEVTVSGTVMDSQAESIIGCSINIKGTSKGTITDIDGKYSLQVNIGDVLEFNYLGFKKQTVSIVSGKTIYDVTLEEDGQALADVVVVGYSAPQPSQGSIMSLTPSSYDKLAEEEYTKFGENKFKKVSQDPISTFSADVDKASYSNIRRFFNQDLFPPRDAVRTEELINYFPYGYKEPTMDNPISIEGEIGISPWNKDNLLCKIGIRTRDIPRDNLPPSNFVFLIDVSGSMWGPTRLELVKSSLSLLTDNLSEIDRVAIVVYAGSAGVVLPSTPGNKKEIIKESLNRLEAGGSTAGGEGIELAYKIAQENFIKGGNNRIIMCSDGDFNVGVTSNIGLEGLIEQKRETGVFLSVLGYGMGNYKDSKMEILAQKGNGNHAYIDNINEAKRVLVEEFAGSLYTVAKDVKLQVEFDPEKVEEYRLIGYETRLLKTEDFENDSVDAGDMGSGHTVTALYELKMKNKQVDGKLLTVGMRYKDPQEDTSKLISIPISYSSKTKTSTDFNFAASVAMFAQLIRNSDYKGNATYKDVVELAKKSQGKDSKGYRKEFIDLVKKADELTRGKKKILYGNIQMDDSFNTFTIDVDNNTKTGMVDNNDNVIVPAMYDYVSYVKGGLFKTELDDKYGLYQYYSGEIVKPIYDDIDEMSETLFMTKRNDKYGVLDLYGKEILEPKYDEVGVLYNNQDEYILVELDDKYGLYNREKNLLISPKYDEINSRYSFFVSKLDSKYGVINNKGKIIKTPQYDQEPYSINTDLLVVAKNNKSGVIDMKGRLIVPFVDEITNLPKDILIAENKDKYRAYNSKGKLITKGEYDSIDSFYDGNEGLYGGSIKVEKDDKYGVVSAEGKVILPTIYDSIDYDYLDNGDVVVIAEKDNKETLFSLSGNILENK